MTTLNFGVIIIFQFSSASYVKSIILTLIQTRGLVRPPAYIYYITFLNLIFFQIAFMTLFLYCGATISRLKRPKILSGQVALKIILAKTVIFKTIADFHAVICFLSVVDILAFNSMII